MKAPINRAEKLQERFAELKRILEDRRREISEDLQRWLQRVRKARAPEENQGVLDSAEASSRDTEDDIGLSLLQMKSEMLKKIDQALCRHAEGNYGHCFACGDEISEHRLRALPFAIRCKDCQEQEEINDAWERERVKRYQREMRAIDLDRGSNRVAA